MQLRVLIDRRWSAGDYGEHPTIDHWLTFYQTIHANILEISLRGTQQRDKIRQRIGSTEQQLI